MAVGNPALKHGNNIKQKEEHKTKYRDAKSKRLLNEITTQYQQWAKQNNAIKGLDKEAIKQKVALFNQYKDFIDQRKYAEAFDSRSNLHSSVLEEFLYYLFKDLVDLNNEATYIGAATTFKTIYFTPPNFSSMNKRPYVKVEPKNQDFIIGTFVTASFSCKGSAGGDTETQEFRLPAVAIEAKTYLDKTMLEGISRGADELKSICPTAKIFVVSEYLKLDRDVNLQRFKVDQIYVLRRQRNTDREVRLSGNFVKNPIYEDLVWDLFEEVKAHLTAEKWDVEGALERGKLL